MNLDILSSISVRQERYYMKSFDAVKTMRDIRTRLSKRYQKDAKRQIDDLRRIHEKYNIYTSQPSVKQPKVAEDQNKYGGTDS
jgi:cytidylate kinase